MGAGLEACGKARSGKYHSTSWMTEEESPRKVVSTGEIAEREAQENKPLKLFVNSMGSPSCCTTIDLITLPKNVRNELT